MMSFLIESSLRFKYFICYVQVTGFDYGSDVYFNRSEIRTVQNDDINSVGAPPFPPKVVIAYLRLAYISSCQT